MDTVKHDLANLFLQLGLDADNDAIETFIENHALDGSVSLEEAVFWTDAQAQFIEESRDDDADWSGMVDELDTRLREN